MEDIINCLMTLIDFNTTCDTGNEFECAKYINNALISWGIESKIWTENKNCVTAFIKGKSSKTLALHAHIDTAEYGLTDNWRFSPSKASRIKGCICGRGALDCKSQLAVWMKIMKDIKQSEKQPENSLLLIAAADEENGGEMGLKKLIEKTDILKDIFLVIGEGGGFPFPFKNRLFYTFQTGEREDDAEEYGKDNKNPLSILEMGISKGYYAENIKEYFLNQDALKGRKLDVSPLYSNMEEFFAKAPFSNVYKAYGSLFEKALREFCPTGSLMPVITPGYSDNRYFRRQSVPTIGFFPLDERNGLGGIHGPNEYISEKSLFLAYNVMKKAISELIFTK